MKVLATNRKARFNYEIHDTVEAGIILLGPEVKSILKGSCSLDEAFIEVDKEAFLVGCNIDTYVKIDGFSDLDKTRKRRLLLNKTEIRKFAKKVKERGFSCVPLNIHYSDTRKIKLDIALVKGKKLHDKRNDLKEKDIKRSIRRGYD